MSHVTCIYESAIKFIVALNSPRTQQKNPSQQQQPKLCTGETVVFCRKNFDIIIIIQCPGTIYFFGRVSNDGKNNNWNCAE